MIDFLETIGVLIVFLVIALFLVSHGDTMGFKKGCDAVRKQLVEDGYAEYYIDNNHEKQWRMKPKNEKEK